MLLSSQIKNRKKINNHHDFIFTRWKKATSFDHLFVCAKFWFFICLCTDLIFFISTNRKYNVQLQSQMILATKKVKEMLSCIRNQCNAPISVPLFAKCFFFSRFSGSITYFEVVTFSSLILCNCGFLKNTNEQAWLNLFFEKNSANH